ncbi:MAG TPA: 16S rRNA (adenine(1518)-N(6)/adenine(1519)-N(6))-dimethyltransferase RsmA [Bacteroidales bacterium]|nr:16S rRNA (adenine(1518)-N(6)/adenine(1519)-N(6))-dimethyltransferase RsmA [Bacteroidales bacterium]
MNAVKPKKHLGQHFLTDNNIAARIVDSLTFSGYDSVLEVGPGTGILTRLLIQKSMIDFRVIELDPESVEYLKENFDGLNIISGDFLKYNLEHFNDTPVAVIGNFPYNISSQILFKVMEFKDDVVEVVGMFQKEVAERISAGPGSKTYGILSVLLRIYYNIEYLFTVPSTVFKPVPKVTSAVIRLRRNDIKGPGCNEQMLLRIVKATFNQRRKMIRNSLRAAFDIGNQPHDLLTKRPEQLGVEEFVNLTNWVEKVINN